MRNITIVSDLELAILGLLRDEPRSGYELRKALATISFGDSPGAVYPALRRLAAGGMIKGAADDSTRRGKERFHITPTGRRSLRDALQKRPTEEEIRRKPDACLLRLRFLDPASSSVFLEEYARLTAKRAAELKTEVGVLATHESAVYAARSRSATKLGRMIGTSNKRRST